jgi:hypothetical protein
MSLSQSQQDVAQLFYQVGRELARRVTGNPDAFHYQPSHASNVGSTFKLWALQARHGDLGTTVRSLPATLGAAALGAVGNTPIEGARIHDGKLVEARASGHGFNLLLNAASAVTFGVVGTLVPPLLPFVLLTPLMTAVPLVAQKVGDTNAPVHEMAHAMQFLLLGDLLNHGHIDASDLVHIQNDVKKSGYLWGGKTEEAAHAAETTGQVEPMFDVLRERVSDRLEEKHGVGNPLVGEALQRLDDHQKWMTRELAK